MNDFTRTKMREDGFLRGDVNRMIRQRRRDDGYGGLPGPTGEQGPVGPMGPVGEVGTEGPAPQAYVGWNFDGHRKLKKQLAAMQLQMGRPLSQTCGAKPVGLDFDEEKASIGALQALGIDYKHEQEEMAKELNAKKAAKPPRATYTSGAAILSRNPAVAARVARAKI